MTRGEHTKSGDKIRYSWCSMTTSGRGGGGDKTPSCCLHHFTLCEIFMAYPSLLLRVYNEIAHLCFYITNASCNNLKTATYYSRLRRNILTNSDTSHFEGYIDNYININLHVITLTTFCDGSINDYERAGVAIWITWVCQESLIPCARLTDVERGPCYLKFNKMNIINIYVCW